MQHPFLKALAVIYLIAFGSMWIQYPGLTSNEGLIPAKIPPSHDKFDRNSWRVALKAFMKEPTLLNFYGGLQSIEDIAVPIDIALEAMMLVGAILSTVIISGHAHPIILIALYVLYFTLMKAGSVFYSFQWDILLLETGSIAALYAPDYYVPARWLFRFLLFKLMLMSGMVKLQSRCPTWSDLTALQYHYASQCLPTPLAWYAHQLPGFFHKLTVGITLAIEIALPFLLIMPFTKMRRVGVVPQLILQLAIMLTGNYTFFNLLTGLLCMSCWEEDTTDFKMRAEWWSDLWHKVKIKIDNYSVMAAVLFVFLSGWIMLDFSMDRESDKYWWESVDVKLTHSVDQYNLMIDSALPKVLNVFSLILISSILQSIFQGPTKFRKFFNIFRGVVALLIFTNSAVKFGSITKNRDNVYLNPLNWVKDAYESTQPWHLASQYGLFRRMTGVAPDKTVARPEIILSGSTDGHEFFELIFKFKPGNEFDRPKWIAPYQPRLDWQMWFAALGNYQSQPWILNLIYKLHHGCASTWELLDNSGYWTQFDPPLFIRADLFHYDFTRYNTSWANRTIGSPVQDAIIGPNKYSQYTSHCDGTISSSDCNDDSTRGHAPKSKWWYRYHVKEYIPTLEKDNPSLLAFLGHHGFSTSGCEVMNKYKCSQHNENQFVTRLTQLLCYFVLSIRTGGLLAWISLVSFVYVLSVFSKMSVMYTKKKYVQLSKNKTD